VLILLAAFSPWVLLRLVPLAEVAAGAAGPLRGELRSAGAGADRVAGRAISGEDALTRLAARMAVDDDADGGPAPPRPTAPQPDEPVDGGDDAVPGGGSDAARHATDAGDEDEPPWRERSVLELGPPNRDPE
jgi:hypothetical protein